MFEEQEESFDCDPEFRGAGYVTTALVLDDGGRISETGGGTSILINFTYRR